MLPREQRIYTKQQLKQWLDYELRWYSGGLKAALLITERSILRRHQILLRKAEYHQNSGHKIRALFYLLRLLRLQSRHSLNIPRNVCAKGLKIMHLGPILINGKAVVGEDCSFHINTALVAGGNNDDAPVLGKGVVIGIGAVVLGGVRVADYTAIGANAVVNRDVTETNVAVAGVPARKISDNGALSWSEKRRLKK